MSDSSADRNPVEELAEEFLARFRRGERPALSEYTSRFPALASEIRGLFPALVSSVSTWSLSASATFRPSGALFLSAAERPRRIPPQGGE